MNSIPSSQPENLIKQLLLNLISLKEQEFNLQKEIILSLEEEIFLLKENKQLYPSLKLMITFPESFSSWEYRFIFSISHKPAEELSEKQLACLEKIKAGFFKKFFPKEEKKKKKQSFN